MGQTLTVRNCNSSLSFVYINVQVTLPFLYIIYYGQVHFENLGVFLVFLSEFLYLLRGLRLELSDGFTLFANVDKSGIYD